MVALLLLCVAQAGEKILTDEVCKILCLENSMMVVV